MPFIEVLRCPVPLSVTRFTLRQGRNFLGREKGCDIEIPDPRISARHVLLLVSGSNVEFVDQNSTNGIFLEHVRIRRAPWIPGSSLLMGDTELRLSEAEAEDEAPGDSPAATSGTQQLAFNNSMFDFNIVSEKKINPLDTDLFVPEDAGSPRLQKIIQRMNVLNKVIKTLNATLSISDLLDRIMTMLFEVLHCDTGYILVTDAGDQEVIHAHLAYEKGRRKQNLDDKLYSKTLVSKVIKNKVGLIFDSDEGSNSDSSLSIFQLRIKTALCCPIHSEGKVFGVIYLDNKKKGAKFGDEDLDLTMTIAGIAGVAVENLQLYKKLRTEALIRDNLKRFVSPNIADQIIYEQGKGNFHLQSQKTAVTVMFTDIRGFTPLSESLEPFQVAQMLNNYFSEMCDIVFKNGGTLDKFIGDCIMVLFNAPFSIEEPEYVAVKTALEMRKRLAEVKEAWKIAGVPEFQVGTGINCGEAVVGSIGTSARMEYTAIGDCVNIASRVCGIAEPGQLLVTEALYSRLQDRFPGKLLGPMKLKGKTTNVNVYEILESGLL